MLHLIWLVPALPGFYWSARGLAEAFSGRGPSFGPGALAFAAAVCLGYALALCRTPRLFPEPDGLLEPLPQTTKALLPVNGRGELCSSIVSNQS